MVQATWKPADLPALSLYFGKVMHARLKPKTHRFDYRIFSILIDIDQYREVSKTSRFFSVNKANLLSFHEKDHGPRDGTALRDHIDRLFEEGKMDRPHRVYLWCNPRVFGYTFNPLSIYFCYDNNGEVTALVYQVHNTFGEAHSYVAEVKDQNPDAGSIRQSADKAFYVSPFLDMDLRYDFRINEPGEKLRIRILENDEDGPILSATFSGEHKEANTGNLLLGVINTLGLTWKIMAGIHFEAFFLWAKGIGLRKRPAPPAKASFPKQDRLIAGE